MLFQDLGLALGSWSKKDQDTVCYKCTKCTLQIYGITIKLEYIYIYFYKCIKSFFTYTQFTAIIHLDKHCVYPPTKNQQLYVILFTKCHPSLFKHSAASWGDGQSWFLFHAEFPFGPEAYGRVVAPKGPGVKKNTEYFGGPFVMDGSEWSLGTWQNCFSDDLGICFLIFCVRENGGIFPKKHLFWLPSHRRLSCWIRALGWWRATRIKRQRRVVPPMLWLNPCCGDVMQRCRFVFKKALGRLHGIFIEGNLLDIKNWCPKQI